MRESSVIPYCQCPCCVLYLVVFCTRTSLLFLNVYVYMPCSISLYMRTSIAVQLVPTCFSDAIHAHVFAVVHRATSLYSQFLIVSE